MCVQGSTFLVAAGMVVSTVAVGPKGGEEIVVCYITSLRLRRERHLPFNLPKAHSTTTCALLRLVLNFLSFGLNPAPGHGFISHGSRGYAGSPKITTGTGTPPRTHMVLGTSVPTAPLQTPQIQTRSRHHVHSQAIPHKHL